jgi:ATP-binding cassette subfamily F protein uup
VRNAKAKLELELSQDVKKTKFIIEAQGLSYSINGRKLIDQLDFEVKKGEKIGIIGANGSGKSTLVRLLIKEIEPDEGKIKHGTNLQITYFDQYRTSLNPNHSLKEIICPGGGDQVFLQGGAYLHVAAYLKKFMFDPKSLNDKVATLSGGQCNRLLLAKSLINPGNLFILDEPTNDLDMDSLEILLELLADYQGTLIVVSHDRDFLERLVTRTIVFANDEIVDCYGGYEDYVNHYQKTEHTKSKKLESKKPENKKQNNNAIKNASAADLPAAAPRKLSYKYVRLLESLPGEINDIENKIQDIENKLSNPDLYSKAPDEFARLSDYLLATQKELDEKMMLWLEVEEMNNNINNT